MKGMEVYASKSAVKSYFKGGSGGSGNNQSQIDAPGRFDP